MSLLSDPPLSFLKTTFVYLFVVFYLLSTQVIMEMGFGVVVAWSMGKQYDGREEHMVRSRLLSEKAMAPHSSTPA